ncbi:hypothetical protein D7X88_19355 [bacterium C-53]|nr:hypothetical protein [Lachnospiraceae bacterium]NBI05064.1 hypothetical protein [Lachnospiraceae bacterium]RKJ07049.1 hypothetical protein D7X88_19355 [bacterium C-53]
MVLMQEKCDYIKYNIFFTISKLHFYFVSNIFMKIYNQVSGSGNITNPDTFEKEYGSFFHLPIISYIDIVTVYIYFINILCNYMEHFN